MAQETDKDLERLLARGYIFEALAPALRARLAAKGHMRHFKAGALIFREGAPGESMMVIAKGAVRISTLAPNAREIVLAELSEGAVFGEISVLDGRARSADAHAATNCTLFTLDRRSLLAMIGDEPDLARSLIEVLCGRIRRSDERMMEIGFLPIPARLAIALLRASGGGAGSDGAVRTRLSLSQTELANMIGSARENVNRSLRKWHGDGVVELKDGWIVIRDRAALSRLAQID